MQKRGVSPVVATTLLVMIVVLVAAVVTFWGKGYLKNVREKAGVDVASLDCTRVSLSVDDAGGAVAVTNTGMEVSGVALHVSGDGEPQSQVFLQEIKQGASRSFPYANMPGVSSVERVRVIPLIGFGVNRPCADQKVELKL